MSYAFVTERTITANQFAMKEAFLRLARSKEYKTKQVQSRTGSKSVAVSWNVNSILKSGGMRNANDTVLLLFGDGGVLGDGGADDTGDV